MKKTYIILLLAFSSLTNAISQQIQGYVNDQKGNPLDKVLVHWENSPSKRVFTNAEGAFSIPKIEGEHHLIFKKMGFEPQEYEVLDTLPILIELEPKISKGAVITDKKKDNINTISNEVVDQCELGKLACCNLAESFENSNTVDVVYSDGVMGGREIQLLGLNGVYSQQLWEGLPYHRGLSQKLGLELVPGPWIERIGINKGIGSVANGFENISGQINIDFKRPRTTEKLFLNGYISEIAKSDFNLITGRKFNDHLATNFFAHTSFSRAKFDNNHDGFIDMPQFFNLNFMNKWHYIGKKGFVLNAGLQYAYNQIDAGQLIDNISNPYRIDQNTQEVQAMLKTAWDFETEKNNSFAMTYRFNFTTQQGNLGTNNMNNKQYFGNLMAIYQSDIFNNQNSFKAGYSLHYDKLQENIGASQFQKLDIVNGLFAEHTYNVETLKIISGFRADWHQTLGVFISPRIDIKWAPSTKHTLKISSGLGFRTPAMISESIGFMVSNRTLTLPSTYEAEKAWNSGMVYKFDYKIGKTTATIEASYFLTLFQNQMLFDLESPSQLKIFYLKDQSRAQSIQIDNQFTFSKQVQLKLSYKNDQAQAIYGGEQKSIPLLKNDKFLANLSLSTSNEKWRMSTTLLVNGPARIPNTNSLMESQSPWHVLLHHQFNFIPNEKFDIYIGAENIFNYMQMNRIIMSSNPNDARFDGGMIWGPMDGRRMYIGAKFSIK
jgi:outer membrane cobalamin receptor